MSGTADPRAPVAPASVSLSSAPPLAWARDLAQLTKPRLSSLVLFTTGGAMALAPVAVPPGRALITIGGTLLVVAGANALNCYLERDSDGLMARTALRPLPQGRLRPAVALAFGLVLSLSSVALLSLAGPPLAGLVAALALVLYVLVYTPMKRRSSLSVLVGAIPGALPPVIGWVGATGRLDLPALVLFAILFLWQVPHSLAIGIFRAEEYARAGLIVHSNEHGVPASRHQILLYSLGLAPSPLLLTLMGVAGWPTALAAAALGGALVWTAVEGWRQDGEARWARGFFRLTLIYMSGLMLAMVADLWL